MSLLGANSDKQRHAALLRDILLPDNQSIVTGDFIEQNFSYLEFLRNVSAIDAVFLDSNKTPENTWSAQAALLNFADFLLEDGNTVLFPYVAIIGAHIAQGPQGNLFTDRIHELFDKLDKRFDDINLTANKAQLVGFRDVEFEAYYCAARMIPFEGHAIASRVYKRVNTLLNKLIVDGEDEAYLNYVVAGAKSQSTAFPSGETLLWANFAANMDRLAKLYSEPETHADSQASLLTQAIQISGNIAVELPEGSILVAPVVAHFSSSWDDMFCIDADAASIVIQGARERIAQGGLDVNAAFVNILNEKASILGPREVALEKAVQASPNRPGHENDRARQIKAAWASLTPSARKVAQLN